MIDRIGYVDASTNEARCRADPMAEPHLRSWAKTNGYDFVIWTDLKSNYEEKLKTSFSVAHAVEYLQSLPTPTADKARDYIRRAPAFIDTPLRRALSLTSWLTS